MLQMLQENILTLIKIKKLTAISRHADIESPVPSICLRPKSFVSGRDFNSLSGTLFFKC